MYYGINGDLFPAASSTTYQQQIICRLLPVYNCPIEYKRLYAMHLWITYYPLFKPMSYGNLTYVFDKLINTSANAYTSSVSKLQQVYMAINSNNFEISSYAYGQRFVTGLPVNTTYYCFISSSLYIKCRIYKLKNQDPVFSQFVLQFNFPTAYAAFNKNLTFTSFDATEFLNGTNG